MALNCNSFAPFIGKQKHLSQVLVVRFGISSPTVAVMSCKVCTILSVICGVYVEVSVDSSGGLW